MPQHIVRQGECFSSIAADYGFFWETLWKHPENARLARERRDPNVLFPGDVVYVPEKQIKEHLGQTEKRHTFQRKGTPALLRLRLLSEGAPRSGIDYRLVIDGSLFSGTTDGDGRLKVSIPPGARKGMLVLLLGEQTEEYALDLGCIDPADKLSGAQARLRNLGYDARAEDARGDEVHRVTGALSAFQRDHQLPITGQLDAGTTAKIKEIFGG